MKGRRSMVLGVFIGLALCAGLATPAAAEDPGQPFWSMYVGNWWQYDGSENGDTWTIYEEVVSSDTTTIPGVKTYHVEHEEDGVHEADSYYELGLAEIKTWREHLLYEYEEVEYWLTVTVTGPPDVVIGKNPIVVPDNWSTTTTGTADVEEVGTGTLIYSNLPVYIYSEIWVEAQETVVTPLGTYQAYRVKDYIHVTDQATGGLQVNLDRTQYNWWVPYIGNIKWQNDDMMETEVLSAMSISKDLVDYDADGQTDIGVYRPSTGVWYLKRSAFGFQSASWGGDADDVPTPGDYDGDGATDIAVYRSSNGWWYIKGVGSYLYGAAGDIPIPADYDGDGAIDFGVYRPSSGWWYVKNVGQFLFGGLAGDIPVPGDYDGDGIIDIAVYRSSTGWWYVKGIGMYLYGGLEDDIPVPADYDGDGITDIALYRPSTGWWYIKGVGSYLYGAAGDIPVPGDYDKDGVTEIGVFRPSNGRWYIKGASTFPIWGQSGDTPVTRNVWIWQETGLIP